MMPASTSAMIASPAVWGSGAVVGLGSGEAPEVGSSDEGGVVTTSVAPQPTTQSSTLGSIGSVPEMSNTRSPAAYSTWNAGYDKGSGPSLMTRALLEPNVRCSDLGSSNQ